MEIINGHWYKKDNKIFLLNKEFTLMKILKDTEGLKICDNCKYKETNVDEYPCLQCFGGTHYETRI